MANDELWQMPLEDVKSLRLKKPHTSAGGLPAVVSSLRAMQKQMGCLRGISTLLKVNQKKGFDCPGCAWPEHIDKRHIAEFCENGAKAVAEEATTKTIGREFFQAWSLSDLAKQSDYWLGQQGRLKEPLLVGPEGRYYEPLSWEKALQVIADELNALPSPEDGIFYTSGRTSNEAAFAYQLFVRLFGCNNLPDCSNLCHESSGYAMHEALGVGKGTVSLEDFDHCDCIFLIGQNPGTNHPRMLTTLQKAARRGVKIIVVNPLAEAGNRGFIHPQEITRLAGPATSLVSLHLQVQIGGDLALFKGLIKELLSREQASPGMVVAWEFVRTYCDGFEAMAALVNATAWDEITSQAGISYEEISAAADIVMQSQKVICCWAMGVTQQPHAVPIIQEIINFLLLRGNFGRPGAGACPVRGHSNVQGDRTMGIYEKPSKDFLQALAHEFHFEPPANHGYDVVQAIHAMHGQVPKVFMAMGGNFLSASPDTSYTAAALQRCRLTVHVSTKLNRSHLLPGRIGLILPCLVRSEQDDQEAGRQFVTVENSMGVVHQSRGALPPPPGSNLKSEVRIIAELANQVFASSATKSKLVPWLAWAGNYDLIRERIGRVIPGFADFNAKMKLHQAFILPHPIRDHCHFPTPNGKAQFFAHKLSLLERRDHTYCLMTIRSHDQYNTTIYGLDDRYRGVYGGRRVLFMNRDDIKHANLLGGSLVDITSHHREQRRTARSFTVVPYDIPRGCLAAYFPETNCLVPIDSVATGSNTPTSKNISVTLAARG